MIDIGKVGKIIITKNLKNQIDYYHKQNPGKEWSGILFFNQTGGNIEKLRDLEFTATNVYLMDIGSETFTSFEMNNEIAKAFNCIGDDNLESLTGFCHSHQNMSAFFSSTDMQELKDNAKSYYFYISLVVCTSDRYVCKIILPTTTKSTSEHIIRDKSGTVKKVTTLLEKEDFLDGTLEIEFEDSIIIDDWVKNRITEINEKKKSKVITSNVPSYGLGYSNRYEDFNKTYEFGDNTGIKKPINTDEEFAITLIMLDSNTKVAIKDAIKILGELDEEDFNEYLYALSNNIDSLHDAVYPTTFFRFNYNIENCKNYLMKFKSKNNANLDSLIKFLDSLKEEYV